MASGGPPDPREMAAWVEGTEQVRNLLMEILTVNQQSAASQAEVLAQAQATVVEFNKALQIKLQEAEISGKIADAEERKKFIIQQSKVELQKYLNDLTLSEAQRNIKLREQIILQADLRRELGNISRESESSIIKRSALEEKILGTEQRILQLKSTNLSLDEQSRHATIRKVAAEARLLDAKLRTSEATQQAVSMLFGLDNKWRATFTGALQQQISAAVRVQGLIRGLASSAVDLGNTLSNIGSLGNVIGSSFMKVQEMTVKMVHTIDRSDVALRSATGAGKEFGKELTNAFDDRGMRMMAASHTELAQAQSQLYSISRAYSGMVAAQRLELTRTAMAAKRFGISFNDTALIVDRSLRIFGITGPEMMNRLYNSAVAIGETPVRMIQNMIKSLDIMAQYSGPRAIQVLQGLSSISKATGVEVSRLTAIAAQFDTFETAATAVSKLNAILGGAYFNSIQMLNASEEKRLYLLRAGFEATNKSWEALSRWERKAVAAASGFRDLSIAAAFYRGNMEEVKKLTREQEKNAESQKQLIQAAYGLTTIVQDLTRFWEEYGNTIAKQILPVVRGFIGVLKEIKIEGVIVAKVVWGLANSFSAYAVQASAVALGTGRAAGAMSALGLAARGILLPLGLATGAYMYFSSKMREKKSPMAASLPMLVAQGLGAIAENARLAAPAISEVSNRVATINTRNIHSLTRALMAIGQISAPDLNFSQVAASVTSLTRAINILDETKITAFSDSIMRLSYALRQIPKDTAVAVTTLIRTSGTAAAIPAAAAGRVSAGVRATSAAVQQARAVEAPQQGGDKGGLSGVLVTDSISINVGGYILDKKIEDVSKGLFRQMMRNA